MFLFVCNTIVFKQINSSLWLWQYFRNVCFSMSALYHVFLIHYLNASCLLMQERVCVVEHTFSDNLNCLRDYVSCFDLAFV